MRKKENWQKIQRRNKLLPKLSRKSGNLRQKKIPNPRLLQFQHVSRNIIEIILNLFKHYFIKNFVFQHADDLDYDRDEATEATAKKSVQPFLLHSLNDADDDIGHFYIKADTHIIPVGNNVITAMDILVKLHYCFDVQFEPQLANFYNFITGCLMSLSKPKSCSVSLHESLRHSS